MEMSLDKPREFEELRKRLLRSRDALKGREMLKVLEQIARTARGLMAAGVEAGRPEWEPLSEVTKQMKGSDRPLVDTGGMLQEISAWRDGSEWYAGIPASSPAATRAAVQEEGAHVPVTDGVRRFFAAQGFPLRADTKLLRIPPRPWLKPAERELEAFLDERLDDLMEPVLRAVTEG